jgi:DNA-binding SARP family transcriptional activator
VAFEPYAEHLYCHLMTVYGKLSRATDIQRVYRELEAALSEGMDAEPSEETAELHKKLINNFRKEGTHRNASLPKRKG